MKGIRGGSSTRGQALVEFALVLPIFLLLLYGVTEFGRAFLWAHHLANASRVGCRTATLPGSTDTDVNDSIERFMTNSGFSEDRWSSTIEVKDAEGNVRAGGLSLSEFGDQIYVTVTMNMTVFSGSLVPGLRGTIPIRGHCVFRHE